MAPGLLMRRLLVSHHLADFLAEHTLCCSIMSGGNGIRSMVEVALPPLYIFWLVYELYCA